MAERLKKEKSNLDVSLGNLESEKDVSPDIYSEEDTRPGEEEPKEDYPWFRIGDINHPVGLAVKLRGANSSLSRFIYEQFSDTSKQILRESDDRCKLRSALVSELDKLLDAPSLYNEERFANIKLEKTTQELLDEDPHGLRHNLLNRKLLEEAYPKEIAKKLRPIIYKMAPRKTTRSGSKRPDNLSFRIV